MQASFNTTIVSSQIIPPQKPRLLGQGTYGKVELVPLPNGTLVARKIIFIGKEGDPHTHPASREFDLLKKSRDGQATSVIRAMPRPTNQDPSTAEDPVLDVSTGMMYFDMEAADLGNLREYLANSPRIYINEDFVGWVGGQVVNGLAWLHERHYLHGDLKPENIVVFSGGNRPNLKLGDLGSAVELDGKGKDSSHRVHRCLTTHPYAAPEMLLAGLDKTIITLAADIYSLGVVLYQMCGSHHPCHPLCRSPPGQNSEGKMRKLYESRPRSLQIFQPRFEPSAFLEDLLVSLTEFNPKGRPMIKKLQYNQILKTSPVPFEFSYWASPKKHSNALQQISELEEIVKTRDGELAEAQGKIASLEEQLAAAPP